MSALCFGLAAVNWVMGENSWQLQTSPVTYALLLFAVVVVLTALTSGGVGLYAFGSSSYGGKGYFYILLAVAGYFAITSQSVPVERVPLYVTLFFLTGLSALVGLACYFLGPSAGFLTLIFPVGQENAETQAQIYQSTGMVRWGGVTAACTAVYFFMLARYGIRDIFTLRNPWRLPLLVLLVAGSLFGGFRSSFALLVLVFVLQFYFEGLLRTVLFPVLLSAGIILLAVLVPVAETALLRPLRSGAGNVDSAQAPEAPDQLHLKHSAGEIFPAVSAARSAGIRGEKIPRLPVFEDCCLEF